jgi:diadenylate cyclase
MSFFGNFFESFLFLVSQMRLTDLIDIVLVWLVVYRIILLVQKTGTAQMLSGLAVLAVGYLISQSLELFTLNWLLEKFFANLFVIAVILFQAEIRRALAHIGSGAFFSGRNQARDAMLVEELAKGIMTTAARGYGGLVVIEKDIVVDNYIETGVDVDGKITSELICSIFHPQSPIHDGAVLVRGGRIHSAGNVLPLSKNPALDRNLGTRHRAAIGLTEETDSLVFVISEEFKSAGIVVAGHLRPHVEIHEIRQALYETFGLNFKPAPVFYKEVKE